MRLAAVAAPTPGTDRPAARVMSDLDAKLAEIARQYDELQAELARPETSTDPAAIRRLGQELARLEPVVEAYRRLEATRAELAGARELRDRPTPTTSSRRWRATRSTGSRPTRRA